MAVAGQLVVTAEAILSLGMSQAFAMSPYSVKDCNEYFAPTPMVDARVTQLTVLRRLNWL